MKTKIILPIIIMLLSIGQSAKAQDSNLSQFRNAPIYLNPSLTGDMSSDARILGTYVNQWRSTLGQNAYQTLISSFDMKFELGKSNVLGVGLMSHYDKAGSLNLRVNKLSAAVSMGRYFQRSEKVTSFLGLGFELGPALRKVDFVLSDPTFMNKINYLDLSTGLHWRYQFKDRVKLRFGFAMRHINRPDISFRQSGARLRMGYHFHGQAEFPVSKKISLVPNFIFVKQESINQINLRLSGKIFFTDSYESKYLQIGTFIKKAYSSFVVRNNHSIGLDLILQLKSLSFGVTADRFIALKSNSYQFGIGYLFNRKNRD